MSHACARFDPACALCNMQARQQREEAKRFGDRFVAVLNDYATLVCRECGAVVWDVAAHNRFHDTRRVAASVLGSGETE